MFTASALVLALGSLQPPIQEPPVQAGPSIKPTLKVSDYGKWQRLARGIISDDGRWYAARISRVDGSGDQFLRSIDGPEKWAVADGNLGDFSDDSNWFACSIIPNRAQAEKAPPGAPPLEPKLLLRRLPTGEETVYDRVATWSFLKGGRFLVILHLGPAVKPPTPFLAGDLEVVDLKSMESTPVPSVSSYEIHDSGQIALVLDSPSGLKGLQVMNPGSGSLKTLAWGKADIRDVAWAKDAPVLGWLESVKDEKKEGDNHNVRVCSGLGGAATTTLTAYIQSIANLEKGQRVAETGGLTLSDDGKTLLFGVEPWKAKKTPDPKAGTPSGVEIWHSKDSIVTPLQKLMANRPDLTTVAWSMATKKGVIVAAPKEDLVAVSDDMQTFFVSDPKPYETSVKVHGIDYDDVYSVSGKTGERTKVLEKKPSNVGGMGVATFSPSSSGRFFSWFEGGDWMLFDQMTKKKTNLTSSRKGLFINKDEDHPLPEPTAWRRPLWTKDDRSLILFTEHEAYRANPLTGDLTKIGVEGEASIRVSPIKLDDDEDAIDDTKPIYCALFDTKDKSSGVGVFEGKGPVKVLYYEAKGIGLIRKSKGTDRVLFRRQSFIDSPDDFVTNLAFSAAKPVSRTNAQQGQSAWGKAELVSYKTKGGKDLEGTLYYPANYQPGKFYPMVTYIYERLSDGFNQYQVPDPEGAYNLQHFVQNGYFVLQPDIVYKGRNPGLSAVDCVESAVRAVLKKKVGVDAAKVGLMGHSWGAYQTVFIATQSKVFSAYVAGAPLTELVTMYSSFYWNSGQPNQGIFESSQGRFDVPFWEDLKAYIDNSPLYHAQNISAPLLVEAGTQDGAVDWTQSQFLYNTLRRMGKSMILLVYPGENHGLAVPANRKDYARRLNHFMDVHLKGVKPESWITEGVPFKQIADERLPKGGS